MNEGEFQSFLERARETVDRLPDLSARNTDLRLVLPLVEALGWDTHGRGVEAGYVAGPGDRRTELSDDPDPARRPDAGGRPDPGRVGEPRRSDSVTVDYALLLDRDPEVFVVTAPCRQSLSPDDGRRLEAAMDADGVDRGIVTNGRSFVFVADDGERNRVRCDIEDLPDRASVLREYSRDRALARREDRRRAARTAAAEQLAGRRDELVEGVTGVVGSVEDPVGSELATACEEFVEETLRALAAGDHPVRALESGGDHASPDSGSGGTEKTRDPAPGSPSGGESPTPTGEGDGEEADGSGPARDRHSRETGSGSGDTGQESESTADTGGGSESTGDTDIEGRGSAGDTEYVVRFFNDRTSVGAVGHPTPESAFAQAVEYLIEQHALDAHLNLPWGPGDDRAVINRDPVHPDGTGMAEARQLSNGYHVCTALNPGALRTAVEKLAEQSGLRVMFQGDW